MMAEFLAKFAGSWCIWYMALTAVCLGMAWAAKDRPRVAVLSVILMALPVSFTLANTLGMLGFHLSWIMWAVIVVYIFQRLRNPLPAILGGLGATMLLIYNWFPAEVPAFLSLSDVLSVLMVLTIARPTAGQLVGNAADYLGLRSGGRDLVSDRQVHPRKLG